MKTLTCATVMLALVAGAAPVMAQTVQQAAPPVWWSTVQAEPTAQPENAYGQPNQIYGMPGDNQASASSHPAE
jgi:hypothetical protein